MTGKKKRPRARRRALERTLSKLGDAKEKLERLKRSSRTPSAKSASAASRSSGVMNRWRARATDAASEKSCGPRSCPT